MDQDEGPGEYQPISLDKIEDFGVHCKQHLGRNLGYTQVMPLPSCDLVILDILYIYDLDFYHQEQQKEKTTTHINTYHKRLLVGYSWS